MLWIFAQAADVIGPGGIAGWTGFGLTGSILCWYFFVRTPASDKMLEKKDELILALIDRQDKKIDALVSATNLRSREEREAADLRSKQEREANAANLQLVIEHCREETRLARRIDDEDIGRRGREGHS